MMDSPPKCQGVRKDDRSGDVFQTGTTSSGECYAAALNSSCKEGNSCTQPTSIFSVGLYWATFGIITIVLSATLIAMRLTSDSRLIQSSLIFPTIVELIVIIPPAETVSKHKTTDSIFRSDIILAHATGEIGIAGRLQSFLPDCVFPKEIPPKFSKTSPDILKTNALKNDRRRLSERKSNDNKAANNLRKQKTKGNANVTDTSGPSSGPGSGHNKAGLKCIVAVDKSKSVPVYWINLQKSKSRRKYYAHQMQSIGISNRRIQAFTPSDDAVRNSSIEVNPRVQNTDVELSCAISHLIAVYTAVHDKEHSTNPYALITEDDVTFEMDVDLLTLAESAPSGFGALQLMTSSSSYVNSFWQSYKKEISLKMKKDDFSQSPFPSNLLWTRRQFDSPYWSTQAYLISKKIARPFIDKVVTYDNSTESYHVRICNPNEELFPCPSKKNCYLPFRIVSDTYIFSGLNPTYLSRVPMFNGAAVGQNTTIHKRKNNDASHAKAFLQIDGTLNEVRNMSQLLPPYVRVKNCNHNVVKTAA